VISCLLLFPGLGIFTELMIFTNSSPWGFRLFQSELSHVSRGMNSSKAYGLIVGEASKFFCAVPWSGALGSIGSFGSVGVGVGAGFHSGPGPGVGFGTDPGPGVGFVTDPGPGVGFVTDPGPGVGFVTYPGPGVGFVTGFSSGTCSSGRRIG
jgi:hypothetical protein